MEKELKPFWRKFFDFNWKFGVFLISIICTPRFILVLKANETANYGYIRYNYGSFCYCTFFISH